MGDTAEIAACAEINKSFIVEKYLDATHVLSINTPLKLIFYDVTCDEKFSYCYFLCTRS